MENNLTTFINHIGRSGIAKKDRYVVAITGPGGMPASTQEVNLMCESISFPGQNIRSVPDTLRFGPAREHAQGITFGPFTAQFICSSDMREKKYFEWWQSMIVGPDWQPNYYDNYKGNLLITQLGELDQTMYEVRISEAWPKTIMPQDMGYAQNNAYHTVGVEFTYRHWTPLAIAPPSAVDEFDAGMRATRGEEWRMRMPAKPDRDFPESNIFTGGMSPRESRATDDFAAFMGAGTRPDSSGRGLTQFRSMDNYGGFSGSRGLAQYRASDGLEGFSGGRGLTQFRMYD